jgi:hypothetical protein
MKRLSCGQTTAPAFAVASPTALSRRSKVRPPARRQYPPLDRVFTVVGGVVDEHKLDGGGIVNQERVGERQPDLRDRLLFARIGVMRALDSGLKDQVICKVAEMTAP